MELPESSVKDVQFLEFNDLVSRIQRSNWWKKFYKLDHIGSVCRNLQTGILQTDRPSREKSISTHGGSLIAVSKSLSPAKIEHNLPKCCVAVEVTINSDKLIICAIYNPPKESVYRKL